MQNTKLSMWKASHGVGGNRKRYQQSMNADQKSIETVFLIAAIENANTIEESWSKIWLETKFSIAICRHTGDKWQS